MRTCRECGETLPLEDFPQTKTGRQHKCVTCVANYHARYYLANRDRIRAQQAQRPSDPADPVKNRIRLLRKYGLTVNEFDELFESQGRACAICRRTAPGGRNWNIDHDHNCCPGPGSCGKCVAGILCALCNPGLGLFNHDPALLDAAADYITSHAATSP